MNTTMKNTILKSGMIIILAIILLSCGSGDQHEKTASFKVYGNCEMCKSTIETSLKGQASIFSSDWNKDSKTMTVKYDSTKISLKVIEHSIAQSGYDTEREKGSDEAYNKLHACCQYERKQ